ncbi:unnamed protein product [Musa banksii]
MMVPSCLVTLSTCLMGVWLHPAAEMNSVASGNLILLQKLNMAIVGLPLWTIFITIAGQSNKSSSNTELRSISEPDHLCPGFGSGKIICMPCPSRKRAQSHSKRSDI